MCVFVHVCLAMSQTELVCVGEREKRVMGCHVGKSDLRVCVIKRAGKCVCERDRKKDKWIVREEIGSWAGLEDHIEFTERKFLMHSTQGVSFYHRSFSPFSHLFFLFFFLPFFLFPNALHHLQAWRG